MLSSRNCHVCWNHFYTSPKFDLFRFAQRRKTKPDCSSFRFPMWYHTALTLVLGRARLGELKGDAAAGEAAVDLGVGVEAVVDAAALLLVEDDLQQLGTVLLGAEALADDLDGVDEVGQDGIVDGGQSARTGALLGLGVAGAGRALGAGQDAARGQDQDVAVGELLLELTGQAGGGVSNMNQRHRKISKLTAAGRGGIPAGRGRGQR